MLVCGHGLLLVASVACSAVKGVYLSQDSVCLIGWTCSVIKLKPQSCVTKARLAMQVPLIAKQAVGRNFCEVR